MSAPFASANGQRIVSASIAIPYYGIPYGDMMIATSQTAAPSLAISIGVAPNLFTMVAGTVRSNVFAGQRRTRFVGGAAGWRMIVPSKHYNLSSGVPASMPINDAASEIDETVVVGDLPSLGAFYTREEAQASQVLRNCGGDLWYVDTAGITQVAIPRNTSLINSPFTLSNYDPAIGKATIATEKISDWMPGRTFKAPTLSAPLTISLTRLTVGNSGALRLEVMTTP